MSFTDTLKNVLATALLAGAAAILAVMAQRSALGTVEALARSGEPLHGA